MATAAQSSLYTGSWVNFVDCMVPRLIDVRRTLLCCVLYSIRASFSAKKSKYVKKWKEWFFILRRGQLEYYETLHFACQGKRRRGVIQLARANVVLLETPTSDRKWPCAMNIFPLKGKAKSISLACESKEDLLLWKHTLDNEIAASVSSAVEMQLKAALRRGPLSQHTRQDKVLFMAAYHSLD